MMQLPLTAVPVNDAWVSIYDATGRRVCAIYGDTALADARDLVNAVNERAALRAENVRLRAEIEQLHVALQVTQAALYHELHEEPTP